MALDRHLTFRVGGRTQAIDAGAVREIVRLTRLTPVPHAPGALVGLGNVRGVAVPILSVGALQGGDVASAGSVLVLDRSPSIGLLVDEVRSIAANRKGAKRLDVDALLNQAAIKPSAAMVARPSRGSIMSKPEVARPSNDIALLMFDVAGEHFALRLNQCEEVIRLPAEVTRLPHADPAVVGTIRHRDAILPLLRLDVLLSLDGAAVESRRGTVLIARVNGRPVGLVVDRMHSVVRLGEDSIDPVPAVIARRASEARIQAIGRLKAGNGLVSILAGDRLVDEQLVGQLDTMQEERGDRLMGEDAHETLLLFRLGDQSFGLPTQAVEEIVRIPEQLVGVPRAPDFIEGVLNLRGQVIPVIDQRRRFGTEVAGTAGKRAILLSLGALRACFVVDQVDEVRAIPSSAINAAPDVGAGPKLFDRTASIDDGERIVLIIEPGQLLDGAERDLLSALAGPMASPTA